jgi:hypothetical protein
MVRAMGIRRSPGPDARGIFARVLPALLCVAVLSAAAVVLFEQGRHSVHHIGEEDAAPECAVAAILSPPAAPVPAPPAVETPDVVVAALVVPGPAPAVPIDAPGTPPGRAPPAPAAA